MPLPSRIVSQNYIIVDLYIPKLIGFDATFMLQILSGEKKVIKFIIILVLAIKSCP